MNTALKWIRVAALALAVVSPAQAGTWIVDQNGGPGVHFTDLPPAIAAALPGDVILVRGGSYTPFTLTKGLTILGKQGPWPTGTYISCCVPSYTQIAPPAGETAVLADLYFGGPVRMTGSAGTVVLDRIEASKTFQIEQCSDVRMNRLVGGGLIVRDTHFEVASSNLRGYSASSHGGTALSIGGISQGLVTRTSCIGGDGADVPIGLPGNGGNGGYGIVIQAPVPAVSQVSTLVLAGGGVSEIRGGNGGFTYFEFDGSDADGLYNYKCGVWRSGCTFIPGNRVGSGALPVRYVAGAGSFDSPISPDDPTLELIGAPSYGVPVLVNVYATPGSVVRLNVGSAPIVAPTPGVRVDKLVSADSTYFLGVVPASGVVSHLIQFRRAFSTGMALYAQASMFDTIAGETRRTNSVPLIMR